MNRELEQLQGAARAAAWNAHWPVGTTVELVEDDGQRTKTATRSEAWTLGHGEPVVLVIGRSGGWSLERIIPAVPDSSDLQATLMLGRVVHWAAKGEETHECSNVLWSVVGDLLSVGSTTAMEVCRMFDLDPHLQVPPRTTGGSP